jgi:uncharacterized YigZ family protein
VQYILITPAYSKSIAINLLFLNMNTLSESELTAEISILSSSFICIIQKCNSVEQAQQLQKKQRELHPKANHHCLAYRLGFDASHEFATDDGEPSGTAGIPMLNVFRRNSLTNCAAVVIRYFGGTKLGKKGLIDAYREAVEAALHGTELKQLEKRCRFSLNYPYENSGELSKILHGFPHTIEKEAFLEQVHVTISVPESYAESLQQRLIALHHKNVQVSEPEFYYS